MKSLPLAYNKDMQEDKEPLFDTVDTLKMCIEVYTRMLPSIIINADNMRKACEKGYLNATDIADYLVLKGMPFREAHKVVGSLVAYALNKSKELNELDIDELKDFSILIEKDIYEFITVDKMIERRNSYGGTGYENVKKAVEKAQKELMSL